LKKGFETIRSLGKTFRKMRTYDGFNKISKDDFNFAFRDLGINLQKEDLDVIIKYNLIKLLQKVILSVFDKDNDDCVNFEEFLTSIRGKPNPRRQAIIDKAFLKFDREGNGYIDVINLRTVFNAAKHPKVVSGEMSQDQVFTIFLKNFNDMTSLGKIERKEWNDYYSAVSFSIDNDDHFVILMKTTWSLE